MSGIFITLEGPEGAGKTTIAKYMVQHLAECTNTKVHFLREPGGTKLGERIRQLLLTIDADAPVPVAELLLFFAARLQLIETIIKPALKAGDVVICDRFIDSTYAYQGHGRGMLEQVIMLEKTLLAGFEPDHTLFFDVTQETSRERQSLRGLVQDRMEAAGITFHDKVYWGYQSRLIEASHRMHRIDANQSLDQVQAEVLQWINETLLPQTQENAK